MVVQKDLYFCPQDWSLECLICLAIPKLTTDMDIHYLYLIDKICIKYAIVHSICTTGKTLVHLPLNLFW